MERLIDLLKAILIWLINKLELEPSLYLGPQFPNTENGYDYIYLGPAASASSGNLLVMQNPGPHPRHRESETLGVKCSDLCSNKSSR